MQTLKVHAILFCTNRVLVVPTQNELKDWEWGFPCGHATCSDPSPQAAAERITENQTGLKISSELEQVETIGLSTTQLVNTMLAGVLTEKESLLPNSTTPISPRWVGTGFIGRYNLNDAMTLILSRNSVSDWIQKQISRQN